MSKDTKGNHSATGEDSLIRDLKKENIRLKSLCRRASEEIRDLDDMIIKSIEDNKVIEYPEEDATYFAGFSSINLLNRLEGKTNGGYVENYDDLHLQLKELDGWYVAEHPDFYKNEHTPECKWHKDWHACDCGAFDEEDDWANTCSFCGIRRPIREDNGVFICEKCDRREEAMKDFKCPECGDPEFRCHHDEDEE